MAPSIPKVMPINERRKIKMEIEKLFDLTDSKPASDPSPTTESTMREEERPQSPPTDTQAAPKMRSSMGSRPMFLEQLKFE